MNKDIFAWNLFLFYITMQHGAASIQDILLFSVILIGLTLLILYQDLKLKRAAAVIFLAASLFCSLFFCSGWTCVFNTKMAEFRFSASSLMPSKLDITGEAFTLCESRWKDFAKLTSLEKKDDDLQMAVLRTCMSDDTLKVVLNLQLPDADKSKPTKVIQALRDHALGQLNIVIKRINFNLRAQNEGESFDDFLTDLREFVINVKKVSFVTASLLV